AACSACALASVRPALLAVLHHNDDQATPESTGHAMPAAGTYLVVGQRTDALPSARTASSRRCPDRPPRRRPTVPGTEGAMAPSARVLLWYPVDPWKPTHNRSAGMV